ncbi:MAG: hypothetical protein JNM62_02800 [Flavobacteriales bacterium]|nr:hypothetical protein [Flavobacteriales bacterium]
MRLISLFRPAFILFLWSQGVAACAQSFDLEQFDQLFRPRLRLDARWTPEVPFTNDPGTFDDRSIMAGFTVPVYKKWTAGLELNLTGDDLKDVIKNSVRVRASQVMVSARYSGRDLRLSGDPRSLHSASVGALGISLTKKYRVLFWSVNMNVSEEGTTLERVVPRFNGVIGKMQVKGLRRQLFYGAVLTFSDGLNFPVPFVGGVEPIGDRWSFQYILPLQLAVGYKSGERTRLLAGIGADGFRSGFAQGDERVNINYTALRAFINVRHKLSKTVQLRAELVGLPVHALRLPDMNGDLQRYPIDPGMSVMVGMNIFFGQSTLERLIGEVLR